jgi:transcriptional regulator with XRE-family HTH domain
MHHGQCVGRRAGCEFRCAARVLIVRERESVAGSGPFADEENCQDFVADVKAQRDVRGWTQQQLADACLFSVSVISNIESFQRAPLVEHGEAIDRAFGLKRAFAEAARAIQEGVSFPPAFRSFKEDEKNATDLFIFEHSFQPGLFQTERYARAVLKRHPNVSDAVVEERVAARLARQGILTREDPPPPRVWALLDEAVLRRRVGDADTMREQLMRVLELSELPGVTIQVIEGMEGHVGLLGAFAIAEGPGRASIVNVDDITDGRVRQEPAALDQVWLTFRAMQTEALPVRASRDLIVRIAEGTWREKAPADGVRALTAAPTAETA